MTQFLKFLPLVMGSTLALLFLGGYVAAYADPRLFWWFALPATGLPLLSLLLVPALVVTLLRRRWRAALGFLGLLLLAGIRFGLPLSDATATAARETSLTVMTYNAPIAHFDTHLGPRRQHRADLISLVQTETPHLIGFQEVSILKKGSEQRVAYPWHIDALPGLGYADRPALYDGYNMKLPVFSRLPILEQEKRTLGLPGLSTGYVMRTRFQWRGREAVHYNVHLYSFDLTSLRHAPGWLNPQRWKRLLAACRYAYQMRAQQAEQLRRLIDAETLPLIVSGDFNSTSHHWTYRHIASGLTDAFAARGRGWGGTWPSDSPLVRIDHVLVSPSWEVTSARVAPLTLSDHRPLFVRLRWKKS